MVKLLATYCIWSIDPNSDVTLHSEWSQYKKKWRQYQNEKSVIVKAQMTLDHNMLIDPPLPQLGYCTLWLSETTLYKMQNDTD